MTLDVWILFGCALCGLLAHGAKRYAWLGWLLRLVIVGFFIIELLSCLGLSLSAGEDIFGGIINRWEIGITISVCIATLLLLFYFVRLALSYILTLIEYISSGQVLLAAFTRNKNGTKQLSQEEPSKKEIAFDEGSTKKILWHANKIFVPSSMPHLVALWIYVTSIGFLLGTVNPAGFKTPLLPFAMPITLSQLFSYNGFGLVVLSLCGVGIFVSRKPLDAFKRLGWVAPSGKQVLIGISLIFFTFLYDYLWSLITHNIGGSLASKLTNYNSDTFAAGGGLGAAFALAATCGLCAGIGEETLIRGALLPVFGILPSAILHGLLHGQFSHAPIYLIQVALWSVIFGVVRRYTNTTTTIIGHAGFNFLSTFLFAFNP